LANSGLSPCKSIRAWSPCFPVKDSVRGRLQGTAYPVVLDGTSGRPQILRIGRARRQGQRETFRSSTLKQSVALGGRSVLAVFLYRVHDRIRFLDQFVGGNVRTKARQYANSVPMHRNRKGLRRSPESGLRLSEKSRRGSCAGYSAPPSFQSATICSLKWLHGRLEYS
jgi:hypothetical protein